MRVLLQSSVTHLHKSEFQLHDLKWVLHLRPHAGFRPILRPLLFVNPVLIPITTVSVVLRQGGALADHFGLSAIGLVTPYPGFFPMQQIRQHRRVPTLAAVATAVWMILVLLSTPTWAFIPKYH